MLEIEASKPPRNDLKSDQRHRNDPFFMPLDGHFIPYDKKNTIKLPMQSAGKLICVGEWAVPSLADFFCHIIVVRFVPEFFPNADEK